MLVVREIKKPLSRLALRGVARDGSLPVGLASHALGKDDDCLCSGAAGNDFDHAFSFPSECDGCQRGRLLSHYLDVIVHLLATEPSDSALAPNHRARRQPQYAPV